MKRNRPKGESITVRLPQDLATWVRSTAAAQYNDPSGIVRMAIAKLREGMTSTSASTAEPQREEAAA
jgi:Arc/MetJ-type ribon-helix-helix transcriptional regulator